MLWPELGKPTPFQHCLNLPDISPNNHYDTKTKQTREVTIIETTVGFQISNNFNEGSSRVTYYETNYTGNKKNFNGKDCFSVLFNAIHVLK